MRTSRATSAARKEPPQTRRRRPRPGRHRRGRSSSGAGGRRASVEGVLKLLARAIRQFHTYPATSPICIEAITACHDALKALPHRDRLSFRDHSARPDRGRGDDRRRHRHRARADAAAVHARASPTSTSIAPRLHATCRASASTWSPPTTSNAKASRSPNDSTEHGVTRDHRRHGPSARGARHRQPGAGHAGRPRRTSARAAQTLHARRTRRSAICIRPTRAGSASIPDSRSTRSRSSISWSSSRIPRTSRACCSV